MTLPKAHGHICARCSRLYRCYGALVLLEPTDGHTIPMCRPFYLLGENCCPSCHAHVYGDAERRRAKGA